MSVAFTWDACVDRHRAEDAQEHLDFTEENARRLLSGSKGYVAQFVLRHLEWALTRSSGGLVDDAGAFRVYKTTREFAEQIQRAQQGVLGFWSSSERTIEKTLAALARMGVIVRDWIRLPQGACKMACYAYKPGPNWAKAFLGLSVTHGCEQDTQGCVQAADPCATGDAYTESTSELPSEQTSDPEGGVNEQPPILDHVPGNLKLRQQYRVPEHDPMFPNDPAINSQPESALTPAQVEDAEPVEQAEQTSDGAGSGVSLDVCNRKAGMLSQVAYRLGKFWFQLKPHSMEELLARVPIQRSGITEDDLDAMIPI